MATVSHQIGENVNAGANRRRYPGFAPFEADPLSRKLFFGRGQEANDLRDLVLAERLVVVYARSGMGKSSLLNAALKEDLWDRGFLPLIVRVNNPEAGPLKTVYDGIGGTIKRRAQVSSTFEHADGSRTSLWHYFKTAEFWHGDLLLTPVLILDQFEELFTLQPPEHRDVFIRHLAEIVRGVRMGTASTEGLLASQNRDCEVKHPTTSDVSDAPPLVKVVLSLREDYLGHLEELSDALPQILQNRFRLGPLDKANALEAIQKPAQFDEEPLARALATRHFLIAPDALEGIWSFLSESPSGVARTRPAVEPFQLQLVCERLEDVADWKQAATQGSAKSETVCLTWIDIGAEIGLASTLASFYLRQLRSLPAGLRKCVRNLCEYGLINRHGRRTSLDEDEILWRYRIGRNTLQHLVNQRLLRADPRLGVFFFELSHDTLLAPIVSARDARERSRRALLSTALTIPLIALVVALFAGPVASILSDLVIWVVVGLYLIARLGILISLAFVAFIVGLLTLISVAIRKAASPTRQFVVGASVVLLLAFIAWASNIIHPGVVFLLAAAFVATYKMRGLRRWLSQQQMARVQQRDAKILSHMRHP